jgi:hypothetical protein
MQPVKDSFYMALRERLTNSQHAEGSGPTPIFVCENQRCAWLADPGAFYLRWSGEMKLPVEVQSVGWRALQCEIGYRTAGSDISSGEDRGRQLAALDGELRSVAAPRQAALVDYSQATPCSLNRVVLWTEPTFSDSQDKLNGIQRIAQLCVLWREEGEMP